MPTKTENHADASLLLRGHIPLTTDNKKFVVAGFLERDGRALLARRALTKTIAPGLLHLPGGHVEAGESLEAALTREFREEFRLEIQVGKLVHTFEYNRGSVETTGFVFIVQASELPGELHFDEQDNTEVIWATQADLDLLFVDKSDHNLVAAHKAFAV